MSDITQAKRLLSLKTTAGEDVLCVDHATVTERVSRPFVVQLEMRTELKKASSVKPEALLGQKMTLTVELPDKKKRHFNGICSRFSVGDQDERFAYFSAEVVPQFWLLTLTTDCKVFQNKNIPDVLKDVLEGLDVEWKLEGTMRPVDYCVQYRETDFNFASRLMEQEGIFYYFKHGDGNHKLVIANKASQSPDCENLSKARLMPQSGMGEWQDGIHSLEPRRSMVPGKYALGDYHFQMSNKKFEGKATGSVKVGDNSKLEIYDYPGEYAQRFNKLEKRLDQVETHADEFAKWRMEEHTSAHLTISGVSTCRAFTTGHAFTVIGQNDAPVVIPGTQGKYVLTAVTHRFTQSPDYETGENAVQPYQNTFTCIPAEVAYRPARTTPRPVIQGLQSAVVVGLSGEEIDCDKYGRVRVQFHWDREGQKDENSSCLVRVASMWAGKKWGMIHIPRIGQEVVVAFLEGDPDQPLIVGSVYNFDNMPPYDLPDNKTQSGIKSRSSKDGSDQNFNEIRFEDKKDSEQIYVHAEKNMDIVVENDETRKVGFDKKDKGDQTIEVFNNQTLKVGTSQSSDGSQTIEIWKDRTTTLSTGNEALTIKKGNRDASIDMGNDALTLKMGNQTTKLDLGKSETEAMQSIEFKVGQNSIKIDQTGITIKGMLVKIEGQMMTDIKGMMAKVNGDALLQVKGGVAMIN